MYPIYKIVEIGFIVTGTLLYFLGKDPASATYWIVWAILVHLAAESIEKAGEK